MFDNDVLTSFEKIQESGGPLICIMYAHCSQISYWWDFTQNLILDNVIPGFLQVKLFGTQ